MCVWCILFLAHHGPVSLKKKNLNDPVLNLFNKVKFSVGMQIDLIAHSRYLVKMISLPVAQVSVEFSLVPVTCVFL